MLLDDWYTAAAGSPRRVVLADRGDPRAAEAADRLDREGLAEAILIGRDIGSLAEVGDGDDESAEELVARLGAVTEGPWAGRPLDPTDPLVIATAAVRTGWAHGAVAGATRPTSDVIRTGLRVLGVAPGTETVSSCFFLVPGDGRPFVFGDCGVIPEPDDHQLASIAISCAATYEQLAGEPARVALLSFSTKGSAEHPRVEKVRSGLRLARAAAPALVIDGELQFDAAWDPDVAELKAPGSPVAGRANVFVFPDLDSGNIAYKLAQRLGGAQAFGPLLQGLDGVLHDLSRGCSADDIVNVAVIASLQAAAVGSRP